jgi:MFS family permease
MFMLEHINPVRAVTAEFLRRQFTGIVTIFIIFAVLIAFVNGLLIAQASAWWWILGGIVLLFVVVGIIVLLLLRVFIGVLMPRLGAEQKTAVREFVDKFERVQATVTTPWFFIILQVVWDLVRSRDDRGYIMSTIHDSTTLHTDYLKLVEVFEK